MEVQFEFTTGKQKSSKLLYTSDRQLFRIRRKNRIGDHYDCYVNSCSAKVIVTDNRCFYKKLNYKHTHAHQQKIYNQFKFEATLKHRSVHDKKPPRVIYDEECLTQKDTSSDIQFEKRRRHLNRLKSKGIPANPKTIDDVEFYFRNEEIVSTFGMLHWKTVVRSNFGYSIFIVPSILEDLPDVRNFRIDGTFKGVPRGPFKQLLIINVDRNDHVSIAKILLRNI